MKKLKCWLWGHDYFFTAPITGEIKPFCRRCSTNFPYLKFPTNINEIELYWKLLNKLKHKIGNLALKKW